MAVVACGLVIGVLVVLVDASSPSLPILLLGGLTVIVRIRRQSWVEPNVLFCLVWLASLLLPVCFAPNYILRASGCWWIFLYCMARCLGSAISHNATNRLSVGQLQNRDGHGSSKLYAAKPIRSILVLSMILSTLYVVLLVKTYRNVIGIDQTALSEFTHMAAVYRYAELIGLSLRMQLLLTFVYLGPLLAGCLYGISTSKWDKRLAIASLMPALAVSMVHTARAVVLYAAILWVAGYLAYRVCSGTDRLIKVNLRTIMMGFAACVAVVLFFSTWQLLRGGLEVNIHNVRAMSGRFTGYFFGHAPAFSIWFDDNFADIDYPTFGARTFGGLFSLLGFGKREMGVYTEFISISPQGDSTNVYTIFRGLIEDFGIAGALILAFMMGTLSGRAYRSVASKQDLRWAPFLVGSYMFAFWPVVSIFTYNSILLAWCLFSLMFLWG